MRTSSATSTLADDFGRTARGDDRALQRLRRRGKDLDFRRGERPVELLFNGDGREEPGRANPTMYPISDSGPYYAALLTGGKLDTKGGPVTNPDGQVLDDRAADPRPLRRRQLRRLGSRPRLLGGRRDARADPRLRLSRGQRRRRRAGQGPRARGRRVIREETQNGTDEPDDDRRAAKVGRDRVSEGVRQRRRDLDRREHPRPLRRRRAGLLPEMGPRQRQGADRQDVRRRRRHAESRSSTTTRTSTGSSRGSDTLVSEGTSHGEHQDGPWRAGVPEWGAGRWCDVFEIRDWKIQRCFIYLDPDYAGRTPTATPGSRSVPPPSSSHHGPP